jgi:serine/threonine protein kinase
VRFIGVCTDPNNLCIVTQFYPRRSVYDLLILERLQLAPKTLVKIMRDAAAGVLHLHCEKVIHRDIATRNVLVDQDWNGHVSDFGMSRIKKKAYRQAEASNEGPIRWMAPEVICDKSLYSEKSDSFSFGVMVWEILARDKPYSDLTRSRVVCVHRSVPCGHRRCAR